MSRKEYQKWLQECRVRVAKRAERERLRELVALAAKSNCIGEVNEQARRAVA